MAIYEKPVRLLMRDMVGGFALQPGDTFTRQQVLDWFSSNYPKIKAATVTAHLLRHSTNAKSRVHHNPRPGDDDLFVQINARTYRLYDPNHDSLPIREAQETQTNTSPEEDGDEAMGASSEFAYESDLRNYLSKNLSVIETGLRLYEDEGITGIEFPVGGRFIDILAVSPKRDLVVVELKVSRGYDRVVGQLTRYMGWIQKNQADEGQNVRGIIIAREITEDLLLACSLLQNVSLFEYQMAIALKPVALHSGK